jgi:hypothetical protein
MIKIKLEPFEVQLACDVATRRFIENLKMGKSFSYGYEGSTEENNCIRYNGLLC